MSKETNIWCENYNEFSELMKILHSKGYKWACGNSALEWDPYSQTYQDDDAGVEIEITPSKTIRYGFRNTDNNISFTAFMIKEGITVDKFTKADLQDGMIMETRDGRYYMYLKKLNKGLRYEGFISLDDYDDDLTYKGLSFSLSPSCCDIVAVYSSEDLISLDFATQHLNLIWKRPEEVVMTISEVEKKLGITNLKIVKEGDK